MFNLSNLNDEYFSTLDTETVLEIKELSTEDKITCFKYFLSNENINNASVIANIFTILNGITDIDEASTDNKLFFNDIAEYVDIKLELKEELDKFNIRLLEYYLGVLAGLDVKLNELKTTIPNIYFNILYISNAMLISKLTLKYLKNINVENIKPANYAIELYERINNPEFLMLGLVNSILVGE